jgi:hypothetical protein
VVKVVEKKLGRHKVGGAHVDGFAYIGEARIEIDPRLSPKAKLLTHVHELWHIATGDDSETGARRAEKIGKVLWNLGYRQVPDRFR